MKCEAEAEVTVAMALFFLQMTSMSMKKPNTHECNPGVCREYDDMGEGVNCKKTLHQSLTMMRRAPFLAAEVEFS